MCQLDLHALDACLTALYAFQVVVWSAVQVLFAGGDGVGVCDREMSSLLAQHFAFPVTSQSVSSLLTYHQDDLVTCIAYHSSYIRAPDNVSCTRPLKPMFLIIPRPPFTLEHDSEHQGRHMRYPYHLSSQISDSETSTVFLQVMDRLQDARLRAGYSQSLCRCYFADVYLEDFVEYIWAVDACLMLRLTESKR